MLAPSRYASLWLISSSATVTTSQPSMSIRAPLGAKPWNGPGPANVPVARQRTAVRLRPVVSSMISSRKSGKAANTSPKYARIPSGAVSS